VVVLDSLSQHVTNPHQKGCGGCLGQQWAPLQNDQVTRPQAPPKGHHTERLEMYFLFFFSFSEGCGQTLVSIKESHKGQQLIIAELVCNHGKEEGESFSAC